MTRSQPRSAIFSMFDSLVVLSEGRSMYSGDASHALSYFSSLGFSCPPHSNPAGAPPLHAAAGCYSARWRSPPTQPAFGYEIPSRSNNGLLSGSGVGRRSSFYPLPGHTNTAEELRSISCCHRHSSCCSGFSVCTFD